MKPFKQIDPISPARFFQLVADFSATVKPWEEAIYYQTKPDEVYDITLISQRVYGRRNEILVIMACAGMSCVSEPLTERMLKLPTEVKLAELKKKANFQLDA